MYGAEQSYGSEKPYGERGGVESQYGNERPGYATCYKKRLVGQVDDLQGIRIVGRPERGKDRRVWHGGW